MTLCERQNLQPLSSPFTTCLLLRPASLGDEQLLRVRSESVNNAAGVAPGGVFFCGRESLQVCFWGANLRLDVLPSAVQMRQAERSEGWVGWEAGCATVSDLPAGL